MFHFWKNIIEKYLVLCCTNSFVEIALKFLITYFISFLIFPILIAIFLNCIIRKMNI